MIVDEQRTKVQREPRRELRKKPTWMTVDDGATKIECFILDVSPGGAKVVTDAALDVRDGFCWRWCPNIRRASPAKWFGVGARPTA